MKNVFSGLSKGELFSLWLGYKSAKESGDRWEELVPFAQEYLQVKNMQGLTSLSDALVATKLQFFEEVSERFFGSVNDPYEKFIERFT